MNNDITVLGEARIDYQRAQYDLLIQVVERLDRLIELTETAYQMFDNPAMRFLAKQKGKRSAVKLP